MKTKKLYIASITLISVIVLTGSCFAQSSQKIMADAALLTSSQAIVGSWYMTVTSDTFPVPFKAMVSFSEGGAVVGSAQGDVLIQPPPGVPPVATAAHGAWLRTSNREFLFTFRQIFYNGDGSYAGGAKIRNAATLDASSNGMTGQLIVDFYDPNDVLVFTGTGSFTATRIVAETLTP